MAAPTLIYCADGNKRFAQIAINAGFEYGAQLPSKGLHHPIYFADQDWKKPDRDGYMAGLRKERPHMATVLDLESENQRAEVLSWAEEAAQYVGAVLIIPKYFGAIATLPRTIGGAEVRLAYSVPTKYGGTEVPVWEFGDWPVHLLGGSPHRQMALARYLNVVSTDGNMAHKLAIMWAAFWQPGTARYAADRYWPKLSEANESPETDAPYVAFEMSCKAIFAAWQGKRVGA